MGSSKRLRKEGNLPFRPAPGVLFALVRYMRHPSAAAFDRFFRQAFPGLMFWLLRKRLVGSSVPLQPSHEHNFYFRAVATTMPG